MQHVSSNDLAKSLDHAFSTRPSSHDYVAIGGTVFTPSTTRSASRTTVIRADTTYIDKEWIRHYIENLEKCTVYNSDFLTGLIVASSPTLQQAPTLTKGAMRYLVELGNEWIEFTEPHKDLIPGPYLYMSGVLKPVLRLFADTQSAFLTTLRPLSAPNSIFTPFTIGGGQSPGRLSVAVPSTAAKYVNKQHGKTATSTPLQIAVKDCYFLKGLKNTLCNSSYYSWSPVAPFTATVVDSLISSGARVIAVAKLSTMIAREEPMDAVDFPIAFNPRGDGYQSPAGSSSGSAASSASYQFIDAAIGTDTSGSGRRPALVNGVWQFRPTHREVYLRGMITTYPRFDTPCVFSRDFDILKRVVEIWNSPGVLGTTKLVPERIPPPVTAGSTELTERYYEIIYPTEYLPVPNEAQMKLIDEFLADMKASLGLEGSTCTIREMNIRDTWRDTHPEGTPENIDEHLEDMVTQTFYHGFYRAFEKFRAEYTLGHDGRPPYVNKFIHQRWEKGAAVTSAENREAERRMDVYKDWWLSRVLAAVDDDDGNSNRGETRKKKKQTMIILPIANVEPNYRDTVAPSPTSQSALDQLFLSPILGSPDIMVPLGDVPYKSRISGSPEYLPVLVNLVGEPGSDMQLLEVVEKVMRDSGRRMVVSTGPRMFPSSKEGRLWYEGE